MIKLVAFDLDGTIGNTLPMCIQAFKKATQPYIGHELSDEEMVHTFGLNEEGMIGCVVDEPYRQQALNDFYVIYKELHQEMCPIPFEGIRELIALLKQKGIIVALITGKGINSCDITLKQFNMKDSFAKVITGNAERNIKSEALKELLHDYHLAANEIVYTSIKWDVDTIDWNNRKEPEVIIERVKKKDIKDGSIVLMHPTYATTQCLDDIIQIIRDKGLKPGMLSNIF